MNSQNSKRSLVYVESTSRWLRRAVAGIDESLADVCRQQWLMVAPRHLAPVPARYPAVRPSRAIAARRVI